MSLCCYQSPEDEDDRNFLDLHHGIEIPVKNRKQTDLQYFVVLAVLSSLMIICVAVAGSQADVRRFIYDYDDKGNLCGFKNQPIDGILGSGLDMTEKKYLQISKFCPDEDCETVKQCVKKCQDGHTLNFQFTPLNARCIENSEEIKLGFLELVYSELVSCWREILIMCFGSICLSGFVLTVLRKFPKIVIRIIIIIISCAAVGWTIFTWIMVIVKSVEKGNAEDETEESSRNDKKMSWIYIAIVFTFFTALFCFMLYRIRNKLDLVAVLFQEGSKCIKDIPMMLLQPILTNLINIVFACFLVFGIICFQTSGKADIDAHGKVYFPVHIFFQIASWLLVFVFIWLSQFVLACQNLVVAGTVSSWYFSRVKGKLDSPVWRSFDMVVKNHLGSAAFGSLLIAIIKAIRLLAKMMERKSHRNLMAVVIFGLLQCLLACIESIVRILNKTAYVMIVLFGQPFCNSARKAYACITADRSKVALIIGVGTFLITAVELIITATVTFMAVSIFMKYDEANAFWIPSMAVFFLSYLCAHCFFSVYEMTTDTLILCFCVDHQMNDGLEKPYYMNKNLMILLEEDDANLNERSRQEDQNMLVIA